MTSYNSHTVHALIHLIEIALIQRESQQVINCPQLQFEFKPGQATANFC
ncbi:hypothetical protein T11_7824 [Trichinella zimbabwensis]|uniref:Uncharacterized protein n=1 Tax=Trichinella zimbabwensis TaxID=268475 RepID=A0A0V1GLQ8_9BILA|nr:hypothetical protein T11_7824 [Trichinella zimbabwensis]